MPCRLKVQSTRPRSREAATNFFTGSSSAPNRRGSTTRWSRKRWLTVRTSATQVRPSAEASPRPNPVMLRGRIRFSVCFRMVARR